MKKLLASASIITISSLIGLSVETPLIASKPSANAVASSAAAAPVFQLPPLEDGTLSIIKQNLSVANIDVLSQNWPPGMTALSLDANNLGPEGMQILAQRLPEALDSLGVVYNNIGDAGAIALANRLQERPIVGLKGLALNANNIGDAGIIALAPHLPASLKKLWLADNRKIGDAGIIALAEHLPNLTMLILYNIKVSQAGQNALIAAGFKQIDERENIWERELDAPAAAAPVFQLPPLDEGTLSIIKQNLSVANIDVLSQNWPPGMTALSLDANNLGPEGMQILAQRLPEALDSLGVVYNNIGDAGAIALANRLQERPIVGLKGLALNANNIGDAGIIALAPSIPKSVRKLWLADNRKISDAGITALAEHLPNLTLLILDNIRVSQAGQNALIAAGFKRYEKHKYLGQNIWERELPAPAAAAPAQE